MTAHQSSECLGFAPATRAQRLRAGRALLWLCEESSDWHAKRHCHCFQRGDGNVLRAALDPADIGPVNAGREGEALLRKVLFHPKPAQVPANDRAHIHPCTRPEQRLDNRRTNSPSLYCRSGVNNGPVTT